MAQILAILTGEESDFLKQIIHIKNNETLFCDIYDYSLYLIKGMASSIIAKLRKKQYEFSEEEVIRILDSFNRKITKATVMPALYGLTYEGYIEKIQEFFPMKNVNISTNGYRALFTEILRAVKEHFKSTLGSNLFKFLDAMKVIPEFGAEKCVFHAPFGHIVNTIRYDTKFWNNVSNELREARSKLFKSKFILKKIFDKMTIEEQTWLSKKLFAEVKIILKEEGIMEAQNEIIIKYEKALVENECVIFFWGKTDQRQKLER